MKLTEQQLAVLQARIAELRDPKAADEWSSYMHRMAKADGIADAIVVLSTHEEVMASNG